MFFQFSKTFKLDLNLPFVEVSDLTEFENDHLISNPRIVSTTPYKGSGPFFHDFSKVGLWDSHLFKAHVSSLHFYRVTGHEFSAKSGFVGIESLCSYRSEHFD